MVAAVTPARGEEGAGRQPGQAAGAAGRRRRRRPARLRRGRRQGRRRRSRNCSPRPGPSSKSCCGAKAAGRPSRQRAGDVPVARRRPQRFRVIRCRLLVVLLLLAGPAVTPASAQIYAWRDAVGTDDPVGPPAARRRRGHDLHRAKASHRASGSPGPPTAARSGSTRYIDEHAKGHGRRSRPGAGRHPGRIGVQPGGGVAQGRDGPDAADAGHRRGARRRQPVRPGREHPRRRRLPEAAARPATTRRWSWPWPPTTPGPAPSTSTASRCPPYRETRDYVKKITRNSTPAPSRRPASTSGSRSWTAGRSPAIPTAPARRRAPTPSPPGSPTRGRRLAAV